MFDGEKCHAVRYLPAAFEITCHRGEKHVHEQDRIANLLICKYINIREGVCICYM